MAKYEYCFIDFETKSTVDLKACGADVYARHFTTDVLCFGYAFDEGQIQIWKAGDAFPTDVIQHISEGGRVVAHNAIFEYLIWNHVLHPRHDLPEIKPEQLICTMAMAYAMALPGALANVAPALGLTHVKDLSAQRVMLKLSQPRNIFPDGRVTWYTEERLFEILYKYCEQDVRVEQQLFHRLLRLNEAEEKIYRLDLKINQRGIEVDKPNVEFAIKLVEYEQDRLDKKMKEVTKNVVATCNAVGQIMDYLAYNGVSTEGVTKSEVVELLKTNIPDNCRKVLLLRQEAAKSSTAKLSAMINGACDDNRVRGIHQYHGASTGRWAGRRIQTQNLPRSILKQESIEEVFKVFNINNVEEALAVIELAYGPPLQVISDCLRGFIIPKENHRFICADFSAIEARVLAWLAGEEKVLEVFRTHGKIYEAAAAGIYNVSIDKVTKEQRQIGKVAVLALGYQGGKGAFQTMAKNYGVIVDEQRADQIKLAWRQSNPNINAYWYQLEDAAIYATQNPGKQIPVGPKERQVIFKKSGSFLFCRLPSGRALCYPYPLIQQVDTPWGETKDALTYMGEDTLTKKWTRLKTYGGKLSENLTQAVARDILCYAMLGLEEKNYPIVMTVHDEIVCEVEKSFGSVDEVETIMSTNPSWAKDLPLSAEGWEGLRYKK